MSSLKNKGKRRNIECLKVEYDKLQKRYGAKDLVSIYKEGVQKIQIYVLFLWIPPEKTLQVAKPGHVENLRCLELKTFRNYLIKSIC